MIAFFSLGDAINSPSLTAVPQKWQSLQREKAHFRFEKVYSRFAPKHHALR
jgi:hypothetical protein